MSSTTFSQTSHSFASLTSTACARQRATRVCSNQHKTGASGACVHVRPAETQRRRPRRRALRGALRACASRHRLHIAANAKKHMKTQSIHERAILPTGQGAAGTSSVQSHRDECSQRGLPARAAVPARTRFMRCTSGLSIAFATGISIRPPQKQQLKGLDVVKERGGTVDFSVPHSFPSSYSNRSVSAE